MELQQQYTAAEAARAAEAAARSAAEARAERLAARLRALGVDPDTLPDTPEDAV